MLSIMRLLLVVFGFLAGVVHAATLEGKAINVADGDTITLLDAANKQYKIRIGGIDAPERKQPYSNRSKQHLDRKSTRLNSSHMSESRMPSSA